MANQIIADSRPEADGRRSPSCMFVTIGCAKNEVDTDRMRALVLDAGMSEAYQVDEADAIIVNTCSFLASATTESLEVTLELAEEVAQGIRSKPIVMCGCVPSRYGSQLVEQLPEVAAFVKVDEEDDIVDVIQGVLGLGEEMSLGSDSVLRTIEGASAYVKISDGCDRMCAFCAIPMIRGRYHSRTAEDIESEVAALLDGGVREIVLIGQDTGI